jgi:hypothetical protein
MNPSGCLALPRIGLSLLITYSSAQNTVPFQLKSNVASPVGQEDAKESMGIEK